MNKKDKYLISDEPAKARYKSIVACEMIRLGLKVEDISDNQTGKIKEEYLPMIYDAIYLVKCASKKVNEIVSSSTFDEQKSYLARKRFDEFTMNSI